MIYNAGTISLSGNTATGAGTNWTAPASQIRTGQTIIVLSNPVQLFQITAINSATSLTVTPAAVAALNGQKYGILVTDSLSVDGLAQSISQLINEYDENIGAWESFASTTANQNVTVTINGQSISIPALGKLVQKGADGAVPVAQGGTGARDAPGARKSLGLSPDDAVAFSYIDAVQAPKCTGTVNTNSGAISLNINIKSVTYIDLGHYRVEFTRRLQAGYVPFAGIITASAPGILVASDCSITSQSNAGFDVWVYDAAGASYRNPDYLTICVFGRFE